jgi:hypothetical protein
MVQEPASYLDSMVGRRFPLMVSLIVSGLAFYKMGAAEIAASLIGGALLIAKGYVDDIAAEKSKA